jgi:hypothetical protein
MWAAYSHRQKSLAALVGSSAAGFASFNPLMKSLVAVFTARIMSRGSCDVLSRAVMSRKGMGMKTGLMWMFLVAAPVALDGNSGYSSSSSACFSSSSPVDADLVSPLVRIVLAAVVLVGVDPPAIFSNSALVWQFQIFLMAGSITSLRLVASLGSITIGSAVAP